MSPITSTFAGASARAFGLFANLGDFELIETQTVGAGGAASITFSSIPSTYKHLQIRYCAKANEAGSNASYNVITFNNDTTTGNYYFYHSLSGNGTSASSAAGTSSAGSYAYGGRVCGNSSSTSIFGVGIVDILDYTSTSKNKTSRVLSGYDTNGAGDVILNSTLWFPSTPAAITSIKLTGSAAYLQYSTFSLYGVK